MYTKLSQYTAIEILGQLLQVYTSHVLISIDHSLRVVNTLYGSVLIRKFYHHVRAKLCINRLQPHDGHTDDIHCREATHVMSKA